MQVEGQYSGFEVELRDHVAVVTFNKPERLNGMTMGLKRDMIEMLQRAEQDDRVRVVLFTGIGKGFCAGDDPTPKFFAEDPTSVPAHKWSGSRGSMRQYGLLRFLMSEVNRVIRSMDKLTIAAINGFAIQSGLSLALACDFRIAVPEAKLGSGTLRYGFLPDEGGHFLLMQYLGVGRTVDFLLRNRIVPASEALELGLVNKVVPADQLMAEAMALAAELCQGPQVAMRLLKRSVYMAAHQTFEQAMDDIALRTAIGDHHPDAKEGGAAWREKRKPKYNAWLDEADKSS